MRVMEGPWESWDVADGPSSVTIGVLDGVHLGHRALLAKLDRAATPTVLTFDPHPVEVLRPGTPPRLITTVEERVALLEDAGVESVGVLDLGEIREQQPEEFVRDVLAKKLNANHLVVGEDFRFGKDRAGDVDLLSALGEELGFEVESIELIDNGDSVVSSSRIRGLIEAGDVATAARLLGSQFRVTNTVIDGDKRGRDFGFPTANIRPPDRKVIPAIGVYSCFAVVGDVRHEAAVNVGVRPTFGGGELLIEAFILDFDDDIYGTDLTLEFVDYTRQELKFDDVDDLLTQMNKDVSHARAVLEDARSRM